MANGLLETFLILFESDSDDVKKGAEEADKSVGDLETSLNASDKAAVETGGSLVDLAKTAAGALGALFAVNAIQSGIISTAAEADEILKFSQRLNENVEEVDAWGGAVVRSGGSASAFRSSLETLNEKLVDTAVRGTSEVLPFFNQLGIAITDSNGQARSTLDVLPELADAFQGLSRQQSAGIGKKLGLDEGTILLLQQGRGEIDKLIERQKLLGVTTEEQAQLSAKFNDLMADTGQAFDNIGRMLTVEALPFLNSFLETVTDIVIWLRENKTIATGFFSGVALAITGFFLPAMVAAGGAVLAASSPFIAIGAIVGGIGAAFALAYDDIQAFLAGNDSVIGELSKEWPIVGEIVLGVVDGISSAVDFMGVAFSRIAGYLTEPKLLLEDFVDLIDTVTSFGGGIIDDAASAIGFSGSAEINTQTPNSISNSSVRGGDRSVAVTGDINVQVPGGDFGAQQAGQATGKTMQQEIRKAVDTFDDGVLA